MCKCENVDIGSYDNAIAVNIPEHMKEYELNRAKKGLSKQITIDTCILEEIKYLWGLGVTTYGSCCGHNKLEPFVNVAEKDIEYMLELGYKQNHPNKDRKDTFKLKQ